MPRYPVLDTEDELGLGSRDKMCNALEVCSHYCLLFAVSEKDFDVTPLTNFLTSQLKNKKRRRKGRKHELKKPKSNNLMRTQKMKQQH